jgi:hypothetical protein
MLRKHPRTLLPAAIEHLNELLDEALKETFPASDPIAIKLGPPSSIDVTDAQLDALEVRGYLDPDRRGERADECDAIEMG